MPSTPKRLRRLCLLPSETTAVHRSIGNRVGVYDPQDSRTPTPGSHREVPIVEAKWGHTKEASAWERNKGMAVEKVREVREVRRRRRLVERMLGLGLGLELEEWGFGDGGMREGVVGVLTSRHLGSN
ncbi:hypothetical protein Sjap_019907 [Stephania japonica]|uniref:Uncharacterized protein n=1 Tax=Stephania japonica TaxID=461633 RepID=A0AAP0F721_9MAGN